MAGAGLAYPIAAAAAVGFIVFGARRVAPHENVELAIGVSAALAAMGLLTFRLRTVYVAVRQAGGRSRAAARPGGRRHRARRWRSCSSRRCTRGPRRCARGCSGRRVHRPTRTWRAGSGPVPGGA